VSVFKLATDQGDVRNAAGAEPAKKRVAESEAAQPGKKRRQAASPDLTDFTAANLAFDSNAA
jgi:hypothetical protein